MKIQELKIDTLFPNEDSYEKARREYIADYQVYIPGGFLSSGYYKNEPEEAKAKWERAYPNGFVDWRNSNNVCYVAYSDLKVFEEKINEIIKALNK